MAVKSFIGLAPGAIKYWFKNANRSKEELYLPWHLGMCDKRNIILCSIAQEVKAITRVEFG